MSRTPAKPPAAKRSAARPAAPKSAAAKPAPGTPAEIVGQTLDRALDPLRSAWKSAAHFAAAATPAAATPAPTGKPGLTVSPNAVPFPAIAPIAGVELVWIDSGTTTADFSRELRWNQASYRTGAR